MDGSWRFEVLMVGRPTLSSGPMMVMSDSYFLEVMQWLSTFRTTTRENGTADVLGGNPGHSTEGALKRELVAKSVKHEIGTHAHLSRKAELASYSDDNDGSRHLLNSSRLASITSISWLVQWLLALSASGPEACLLERTRLLIAESRRYLFTGWNPTQE